MNNLKEIIRRQITLSSSKIAAEKMSDIVSGTELSILSILFVLGETAKEHLFALVERDYTTITHAVCKLCRKGYIVERYPESKKKSYVKLTTAGTAIYTQYIIVSSKKAEHLRSLMPKTHIEKENKTGENSGT